jgi:uncharacterized protein with GYD domain
MATFIALIDYTEQGIQAIGESPARAVEFVEQAEQAGVKVKDIYWTHGEHDGVLVFEAPNCKAAAALMLTLARKGNVRTRTLRAFGREEMQEILAKTT